MVTLPGVVLFSVYARIWARGRAERSMLATVVENIRYARRGSSLSVGAECWSLYVTCRVDEDVRAYGIWWLKTEGWGSSLVIMDDAAEGGL